MKWAIICGKIRDPIALSDNINFLGKIKQQGLLQNIILSTWVNDLFLYPDILSLVKKYEIIILENTEDLSITDLKLKGNYLKQYIATHSALTLCPPNSFILKLRTDKSAHVDGFIHDKVSNLLQTNTSKFLNIDKSYNLNYRIGISQYPTAMSFYAPIIFFWDDKYYYGQKEDLLKIVNFNFLNLTSLSLCPEQSLWSNYFVNYHPEFTNFFEACNQQHILDYLFFSTNWSNPEYVKDCQEFCGKEPLIVYCYLLEMHLLNKIAFNFHDQRIFNIRRLPDYVNHNQFFYEDNNLKKINDYFSNKDLVLFDTKRIQRFLFKRYGVPRIQSFLKNKYKYDTTSYLHTNGLSI
jgi:hypothetical protein